MIPIALHQCPCCEGELSPHDARCPHCTQVVGVDNVCPHCRALAPVLRHAGRLTCSVCDSMRDRGPNTVVVSARELRWRAGWERLRIKLYKASALISTLYCLFVGLLFWVFSPASYQRWIAIGVVLAIGLSVGLASWLVARVQGRRTARESFMRAQQLCGLAFRRGGVVTAAEVSRALQISMSAADAMLDGLVRAGRADMNITERGDLTFTLAPVAAAELGSAAVSAVRAPFEQRQTQSS